MLRLVGNNNGKLFFFFGFRMLYFLYFHGCFDKIPRHDTTKPPQASMHAGVWCSPLTATQESQYNNHNIMAFGSPQKGAIKQTCSSLVASS